MTEPSLEIEGQLSSSVVKVKPGDSVATVGSSSTTFSTTARSPNDTVDMPTLSSSGTTASPVLNASSQQTSQTTPEGRHASEIKMAPKSLFETWQAEVDEKLIKFHFKEPTALPSKKLKPSGKELAKTTPVLNSKSSSREEKDHKEQKKEHKSVPSKSVPSKLKLKTEEKKSNTNTQPSKQPAAKKIIESDKQEEFKTFLKLFSPIAKTVHSKHESIVNSATIKSLCRGKWYCNLSCQAIPELQQFNYAPPNTIAKRRFLSKDDERVYEELYNKRDSEVYDIYGSYQVGDLVIHEGKTFEYTTESDPEIVHPQPNALAESTINGPWKLAKHQLPSKPKEYEHTLKSSHRVFPCGHCYLDLAILRGVYDLSIFQFKGYNHPIVFTDKKVQKWVRGKLISLYSHCMICGPRAEYNPTSRLRLYARAIQLQSQSINYKENVLIVPPQCLSAILNEIQVGQVIDTEGYKGYGLWIYEGNSSFVKVPTDNDSPIWLLEYMKLRGYSYYLNEYRLFDGLPLPRGFFLMRNDFDQYYLDDENNDKESDDETSEQEDEGEDEDDSINGEYIFSNISPLERIKQTENDSENKDTKETNDIPLTIAKPRYNIRNQRNLFVESSDESTLQLNYSSPDLQEMYSIVFTRNKQHPWFDIPVSIFSVPSDQHVEQLNLMLFSSYTFGLRLNDFETLVFNNKVMKIIASSDPSKNPSRLKSIVFSSC
jgi:hypothetical protein